MIAKKLYYTQTEEFDDRILTGIYVDTELIRIMQSRILEDIKDAACFAKSDANDPDEIDDAINYLKDLIGSYKVLSEALKNIACAKGISNIPSKVDEE